MWNEDTKKFLTVYDTLLIFYPITLNATALDFYHLSFFIPKKNGYIYYYGIQPLTDSIHLQRCLPMTYRGRQLDNYKFNELTR